jgi:hypothetical protein
MSIEGAVLLISSMNVAVQSVFRHRAGHLKMNGCSISIHEI